MASIYSEMKSIRYLYTYMHLANKTSFTYDVVRLTQHIKRIKIQIFCKTNKLLLKDSHFRRLNNMENYLVKTNLRCLQHSFFH